jgi:hypothetical protein
MVGVEQDGSCFSVDDWFADAVDFWETHCGSSADHAPDEPHTPSARDADYVRLLGQAWIWTGEWEQPLSGNWEADGTARYGPDGYAVFPWGLLGYRADEKLPIFALHTTPELNAGRDQFLFSSLTVLVLEHVKAAQFLRARYQESLAPALDHLERELLAASDPRGAQQLSLKASERKVRELTQLLFDFSQQLASLEDDARGLELARDAVAQLLNDNRTRDSNEQRGRAILAPQERLAQQARSDLAYYRASDERGRRALESHRTIAEIEQARGQTRLTVIGILIGTFVGIGQIIPEAAGFVVRFGASAGVGLVLAWLYWVVSARKRW